jgi:hypothetical protein
MFKNVSRLCFDSLEHKQNFVMGFLSISHDKSCSLELINRSNQEIELCVFGEVESNVIKKIEQLYGVPLIFNQCYGN